MREASVINAFVARSVLADISLMGGDADGLQARLGIETDADDGVWLMAKFTALLEAAALERREDAFGLALGRTFRLDGLGPIARLMRASSCAAEALAGFSTYYPQNNTRFALGISGDVARLSYVLTDASITQRRQDADFTIAQQRAILSELVGAEIRPLRVEFQHRPDDAEEAERYRVQFECDASFGGRENAIEMPAQQLLAACRQADPVLREALEADFASAASFCAGRLRFRDAVDGWMTAEISLGRGTEIAKAAAEFGMSLRSFQRRLSETDVNYLDIRNEIRARIGRCLLASTAMSVTEIGLYLGFSETSAFSRHFKQMNGASPAQFRLRRGARVEA